MKTPCDRNASMEYVSFTHMEDGTAEDWALINSEFNAHASKHLPDSLMETLRSMKGPTFGYQIDRYRHSLQSATRALKNGESDEMIVAALFHDVADPIAPTNHSAVAAEILKPYVDERIFWIIRHHGVFQGYYYFHHLGGDRDVREIFREHEWFDDCAFFCHEYDQNCFDPGYDEMPLEEFAPLVNDIFSRPSRFGSFELA
mgnify:CR=1 FL=1